MTSKAWFEIIDFTRILYTSFSRNAKVGFAVAKHQDETPETLLEASDKSRSGN